MKRLASVIVLTCLALGWAAAPALADGSAPATNARPGSAADDGRRSFGLQPAGRTGPDARAFYSYSVTPGAVLTDRMAIRNISDRAATLTIYPADAFNTPQGGFDVAAKGVKNHDVGAWLRVRGTSSPFQITVPARTDVLVPISMKVPLKATPGDHAGGIVASLRTLATTKDGSSVAVDERVGVRVYTRVSGKLRPHLSVNGLHARFEGGAANLQGTVVATWTVRNTGNVILGGRQNVRVAGWGTSIRGPRLATLQPLLPGQSHRVTVRIHDVPRLFRLAVTATVHPLSLKGVLNPRLHPDSATTHVWAPPWAALGVTLLVVGLGGGGAFWMRRRRGGTASGGGQMADVVPLPDHATVLRSARPGVRVRVAASVGAAVVGGLIVLGSPMPAQAASGLTFVPGNGLDITPTYVVTPGPCPEQATNVVAVATGHGFPAKGQVVITNSMAPVRHDAPMVIHLQDTFEGFAAVNATKLAGDYQIAVRCIDHLDQHVYATYTGTITFSDARHFTAPQPSQAPKDKVIGAAQPGAVSGTGQPGGSATTAPGGSPVTGGSGTGSGSSGGPGASAGSGGGSASGAGGSTSTAAPSGAAGGGSSGSAGGSGQAAADRAASTSSSGSSFPWLVPAALAGGILVGAVSMLLARRDRTAA